MDNLLKLGTTGEAVRVLQSYLNYALKLQPRLVPDGKFGPRTEGAVKLFQRQKHLTADGVAGLKTLAALGVPGLQGSPVAAVIEKSQCQANVDIPSAPLWHMANVAKNNSQESLALLQNAIDYLTCKSKAKESISDNEKEFLKELYEAMWWGGKYRGFHEAASLADHYVNGDGSRLKIDSKVYETSVIVQDTQRAMKSYIAEQVASGKQMVTLKSTDTALQKRREFKDLQRGSRKRNVLAQGHLVDNGVLLAEQSNARLKNADNRFVLSSISQKSSGDTVSTKWSVTSYYDFEPFEKANYVTELPLSPTMKLKLPDGLSNYMVTIGAAKEFEYFAEWNEMWTANVEQPAQ